MKRLSRCRGGRAVVGPFFLLLILSATSALSLAKSPTGPDTSLPVRVDNPKRLGAWQLPAERIAIGPGYKPSLALLPGGELVMVALFQEQHEGKLREWTGLWRSKDG